MSMVSSEINNQIQKAGGKRLREDEPLSYAGLDSLGMLEFLLSILGDDSHLHAIFDANLLKFTLEDLEFLYALKSHQDFKRCMNKSMQKQDLPFVFKKVYGANPKNCFLLQKEIKHAYKKGLSECFWFKGKIISFYFAQSDGKDLYIPYIYIDKAYRFNLISLFIFITLKPLLHKCERVFCGFHPCIEKFILKQERGVYEIDKNAILARLSNEAFF